jgi:chromosome segregation protein
MSGIHWYSPRTLLLKTLSLAGFKAFADRTRLEFHSGVNVVVGPNGSGKSNLLDALAWVMGTQATTNLRTHKMEDVIFAGTATRPRLGRSEVTLTFDNRDRLLPLDLDDIAMTRRLYRDGTSEYELNGTPCRLLDLHDLLADGGVGRHQHVLVGQGRIGDILSARPEEHRAVIEEAAGVTKHRGRRDRSIRRLEQTDMDVARLTDILEEQRRRLRPLKRQANAAERYDSVKDAARALHLWVGGDALRGLRARSEAAVAEKADLESTVKRDGADLAELIHELDGLRLSAGRVGLELERDTAAAARLETLSERLQRIASVARERRRALEGRLAGAGERRRDLEAEHAQLSEDIETSHADELTQRADFETLGAEHRALEDEERSLSEQVGLTAEGLVANLRGDLRALEAGADRDEREVAALGLRRKVVTGQLDEEQSEQESVLTAIESTDAEVGRAQSAYEDASAAREAAQARWEDAEEQERHYSVELARAQARQEAIESALAGEGDPAARDRAASADEVLGPLVERLDVPEDVAPAVDGSLGPWRDALLAEGIDALARVATLLKSDGLGGVPLVAVGDSGERPEPARRVAAEFGADALVDRLGPRADTRIAVQLLGDVVLVENWTTGWDLVRKHPDLRAATPEGDLIERSGMLLAQPDGVGPAALEAAGATVEGAERSASRAATATSAARGAFDASRDRERATLEELEALEARLAGHTEVLGLIDRARAERIAELNRLDQRKDALAAAAVARDERMSTLRDRLGELEGEDEARQETWVALSRRRSEVSARKDAAGLARDHAASDLARTLERRRLLAARLTTTAGELETLDEIPVDGPEIDRLSMIEAQARRGHDLARGHVGSLRDRQRELRQQASQADAELATASELRDGLQHALETAKERLAALAIELTEVAVREEATLEALRRDADASEQEALAAPEPSLEEGVSAADAVATLEARLRRMGPVNPLAAEEYRELAAAVEMLETQLADLQETRSELKKVVAALDEKMAVLFVEAFEDISRLFEENFSLVFPGGKGRLSLTNPANPLEAGVEIEAQPLGKKVGRLSLLSGGERSLAALAFLFAVFRARPSPFYVLDEVEAALDDSNLRRFLRLVDTLRNSAQLVIITHQQQTMEAADMLYGVTMEPGESSLVVAKRFVDSLV